MNVSGFVIVMSYMHIWQPLLSFYLSHLILSKINDLQSNDPYFNKLIRIMATRCMTQVCHFITETLFFATYNPLSSIQLGTFHSILNSYKFTRKQVKFNSALFSTCTYMLKRTAFMCLFYFLLVTRQYISVVVISAPQSIIIMVWQHLYILISHHLLDDTLVSLTFNFAEYDLVN